MEERIAIKGEHGTSYMTKEQIAFYAIKCPDPNCGAYGDSHSVMCSTISHEERLAKMRANNQAYYEQRQRDENYRRELIKQVTFWQGKCAILRHENNKLRSKLNPKIGDSASGKSV